MANQLYGYSSSYGGAASSSSLSAAGRSLTGSYISDRTLNRYYLGLHSDSDPSKYSSAMYHIHTSSSTTPPPGVDIPASISGLKRSSEALYHATVLDAHNTIGQTEAWYSTNSLAKRSRFESAINFSIYPQRPGEKDCAHYMLTRTCKFGDSCKFDHPIWVPEGGIPNWKEVPLAAITEPLPERPGQPDCPYFLKTQRCMYGAKCKFNHPKDKSALAGLQSNDVFALPERASEPICAFYVKTGRCKFGATCKFNHPKDIEISAGQDNGNSMQNESAAKTDGTPGDINAVKAFVYNPALLYNSKGLPIRPGEGDCPFYLKTGSCKYGATCRYNHPDRSEINPPAAVTGHPFTSSSVASLNTGVVNPAASIYQAMDPRFAQPMLGLGMTIYPQRPGQAECDYYMKSGECKFGERCKFHHPVDRLAPTAAQAQQNAVKLTLAGLPRREGAVHCPYYMKTGACKYGATCKFDHPPPGEVMAASSQATSNSAGDA